MVVCYDQLNNETRSSLLLLITVICTKCIAFTPISKMKNRKEIENRFFAAYHEPRNKEKKLLDKFQVHAVAAACNMVLLQRVSCTAHADTTIRNCGQQIVFNRPKWLAISAFRSVRCMCSCSSMRFVIRIQPKPDESFSKSDTFFFFFFLVLFIVASHARMCGLYKFEEPMLSMRRIYSNACLIISFLSFYLPIKNSHKSQKWRTFTQTHRRTELDPFHFSSSARTSHVRIKINRLAKILWVFAEFEIGVRSFFFTSSWTFAESPETLAFMFKCWRLNVAFGCRTR